MTSESLPTTTIDVAVVRERVPTRPYTRLKKIGAYISLASIVGTTTGAEVAQTVDMLNDVRHTIEAEYQRFSSIEAGPEAPLVIQAPMCEDELDINEGMEDPATAKRNQEIEAVYEHERSSIVLAPKPRKMPSQPTVVDKVEKFFGEVADRARMTRDQAVGAVDALHEALHPRARFISEVTGMEVVFSGTAEFTVNERNFDALQRHVFDPDNYQHSQQRQLVKCVEQKLVKEKTEAGKRMYVVVGGPGTLLSGYQITPDDKAHGARHRGVALPVNLVPLPEALEGEVLIMVTPASNGELKLSATLGHELYHAGMHLIDLPIRADPDEQQAEIAEDRVITPWLDESRKVISYR